MNDPSSYVWTLFHHTFPVLCGASGWSLLYSISSSGQYTRSSSQHATTSLELLQFSIAVTHDFIAIHAESGFIMSSSASVGWSCGAIICCVHDPNGIFTTHHPIGEFTQYRKQFWNTTPGATDVPGTFHMTSVGHIGEPHELQLSSLNLRTSHVLMFNAKTVSPALTS